MKYIEPTLKVVEFLTEDAISTSAGVFDANSAPDASYEDSKTEKMFEYNPFFL